MRMFKELIDLADVRWHVPFAVGRGYPALLLPSVPFRRCYLAFTSRELCEAATARWLTALCEPRLVKSLAFKAMADGRRVQVVVDLEHDGEKWIFATPELALLSPGGDA